MKRLAIALSIAILMAAAQGVAASMHQITLTDGSVLQGKVLSLDAKQLLLATSYADSLSLPREQIVAIVLRPDLAVAPAAAGSAATSATPDKAAGGYDSVAPVLEGTGTLELAIKGDAVRSSTRYRNKVDRERVFTLNKLYLRVYMNGKQVYEDSDDSMEKEFREGQWFYLRNTHRFEPVSLEVPAGTYRVHIVVGNQLELLREGESQSQLASAELQIEKLEIRPDEKTRVILQGEGSHFSYGKYSLELLSSR